VVISSLVVECVPEKTEAVARELPAFSGVEVHSIEQGYKIVITVESETVDDSYAETSKMIGIDGVTGVNLIYVNFEDDPTINPVGGDDAGRA
jgi:nitrate reductase NapD